jgi:hypothetical protein
MLLSHSTLVSHRACNSSSNRTGTLFRLAPASLPRTHQVVPANLPSILLMAIRSTMALASLPRILLEEAQSQAKVLPTQSAEAVRATRDLHTPLISAVRVTRALHL